MDASSTETQRLFVAVVPPAELRETVGRACRTVPADLIPQGLRWVPADNLHLTLHFLGSVPAQQIDALRAACVRVAARTAPFQLHFRGSGAFPRPSRAQVLWVGVDRGTSELRALAEAVMDEDANLGFAREAREFAAHLTLARIKRPTSMKALLTRLVVPTLEMSVRELVLMRSHLGTTGARYESIASFSLVG